MGQALCACAGRADDEAGNRLRSTPPLHPLRKDGGHDSSLLQTQSRAETRELLSDEEREAIRNSVRVLRPSTNAYAQYGYGLPPTTQPQDGTESDEIEYYNRLHNNNGDSLLGRRRASMMSHVTAEAFRSKLREQIMSPRSKMELLVLGGGAGDDHTDGSDSGDACHKTWSDGGRRDRSASAVYDVDPANEASISNSNYSMEDDDVDDEEEYFEFIRIIVPPGPCGVVFQPPTDTSMPPTVEGFVRMYDGSKGAIENCGLVQKGSILCAINDLDVAGLPLTEVVRALNLSSHLEREFVFRK